MPRQMHYRDFTCEGCGTTFQAARSDARFCARCGNLRKVRDYERRNLGTCQDCGAPIVRNAGRCRACATKARDLTRERNPYWRGGRTRFSGYIYVRNPNYGQDDKRHYVAEHVLVWEKASGQSVPKGWHVHHLNGIRTDNRSENLVAMSASDHHADRGLRPYEERIRTLEQRLVSAGLPIS
jgi:hypothetical protein